ncbi:MULTISPECIES: helix-turn-helix domain-containing protein [Photorhabdus]|uniref:Helix-turn-helix domain-containing protein n=2 Tax=Photorhabdus TaxID=29487 RepID=A0ABX0B5R1_9GAMM|nr:MULTISPECIES: helix-turn-helix transcriptional regulator [Photorhabdus]MCC8374155.1 helix-turn-helix transcriptional regulator [Photorhabdus bodei]MCC8464909.1 helix-turn-helix transcriptional regulator [Photorhabdus bodei]MCT8352106.1 helix-turn-helix domain-containing protein [Photorhabdus kayaii]MDB6370028.1 helix-turn-helix transcriptional regulator [Photorhabdus bodei]MDB6374190.1 helix-turn-helix transcriptional regulator [Photorhabdus bodei]
MPRINFITDENGVRQSVILPIAEYERLLALSDRDEDYVSVSYEVGENDEETIPHEVVGIMVEQQISIIAAWRVYRDLSQSEVAEKLGVGQSAVSQWEKSEKPRRSTLEKLATLYDCRIGQLMVD